MTINNENTSKKRHSNQKLTMFTILLFTLVAMLGTTTIHYATAQTDSTTDSMKEITEQIINNLTSKTSSGTVQLENIRQAESMVFGKPVILDTPQVNQTISISDDYDVMVQVIKGALLSCASDTCSDETTQAEAKRLADTIIYWQEIKENLEVQTNDKACDVNDPATCRQLDLGDEPQAFTDGITVGTDNIWDGWYREIRSPFYPQIAQQVSSGSVENIITVGPMAKDECSTVIKEIQGIKSIQRPVKIPIWQEPWTSRAQIIGYNTIWVVDFVPAEFIKNLNYCNVNGSISFDYDIHVIIERQLLHFWKYFPAGVQ